MNYPLATLAPVITPAGITAPALTDIINSLVASAQIIFGADIYLGVDSQDYQLLAIQAQAIYDTNQQIIAVYNAFSPSSAIGAGLSSVVKINGIQRQAATNSTAILSIGGQVGSILTGCIAQDENGNQWALPAQVEIPPAGTIDVTGTCATPGAIAAPAGTIDKIFTPSLGWQTVTNNAPATIGVAVEEDGALRQRQTISTSLPAQTPLQAIAASVANVAGVTRSKVYENNTSVTDANGIPSHSIAAVVAGGDAQTIANVIEAKKSPGTGAYGSTTETVIDPEGLPLAISFFELATVPVYLTITILPLAGYVSTTGVELIQAVVNFLNESPIGGINGEVYLNQVLGIASLQGSDPANAATFVITNLTMGLSAGAQAAANLPILFNQAATCSVADITLVT